MSDLPRDPELSERFAELRRLDAARAPEFARMIAAARAEAAESASDPATMRSLTAGRVGADLASDRATMQRLTAGRVGADLASDRATMRSLTAGRAGADLTSDPATPPLRLSVRTWKRLRWAGALAAAAALVLIIANPRGRSSEVAFERAVRAFETDPALGAWRSPTAGLLELPGSGLLSSIPAVGAGAAGGLR